jgi:hypothetical protein
VAIIEFLHIIFVYQMIDYIAFTFFILLFLGPPIYLWLRWIKAAIISRNTTSKIASISSFILFVSGFIISWFGPEDPFEQNSLQLTLTGVYLVFHFFLTFFIPILYFYSRWLYRATQNKKWLSVSFRLGLAVLPLSYLIYSFILISVNSTPNLEDEQSIEATNRIDKTQTCEWGTQEAIKDFQKGKLMLIRYGLEVESATPYWNYLELKYKIYIKSNEGCVINRSSRCYNEFMVNKIEEKYGKGFLEKVGRSFEKND